MKRKDIILIMLFMAMSFLHVRVVYPGVYLNSAHGNSTGGSPYGVDRSSVGDYDVGHCAHCHEQHASIGGSQPAPVGSGPSSYLLFEANYVNQTDGICFECHKDVGSYQTGGSIVNRSYSYRAGGWNADPVNDLLESFSFSSPDSSHSLDNIKTFITSKSWGYTSNSNPCNACHNPHAAQGDPANSPNSAKTAGTRGYPVSRPSQHSTDNNAWGLWGDGAGEKMSVYTTYQAPYRFNTTSAYEPEGEATADASKLTDYVTFCTDCHNNSNVISSTALGRNVRTFNWGIEKHGEGAASDACADIYDPYFTDGNCGSYVLSCTDCHEPHGSPNIFLIRKVVNGGVVTVDSGTGDGPEGKLNKEYVYLCQNCHDGLLSDGFHVHPNAVPGGTPVCSSDACHFDVDEFRPCAECHFHGNNLIDGTPYGEQLF